MSTGKLLRERWLPSDWTEWDRAGRVAYLCHTHQRADFAVSLGIALGFEPSDPAGRFTKAELGTLLIGYAALTDGLPVTFASTRSGLIEQLASDAELFVEDPGRMVKVEVAGLYVAFYDAGLQVFKNIDPSVQTSRPIEHFERLDRD